MEDFILSGSGNGFMVIICALGPCIGTNNNKGPEGWYLTTDVYLLYVVREDSLCRAQVAHGLKTQTSPYK